MNAMEPLNFNKYELICDNNEKNYFYIMIQGEAMTVP